jgi:lysophospholipase L1-like esterase
MLDARMSGKAAHRSALNGGAPNFPQFPRLPRVQKALRRKGIFDSHQETGYYLIQYSVRSVMKRILAWLPLFAVFFASCAAVRPNYDWGNMSRYAQENGSLRDPEPGEQRIVFMGDSITEGWTEHDSAFFTGKAYVNRGISGQTTPQMLLRFRQDVIGLQPKAVVILAGTNDIAQNTGPISLEQIMGNIISMAEMAKADRIRVLLCSVLPANYYGWSPRIDAPGQIAALNLMIQHYAAKSGAIYVDYYAAMVDEKKGMRDGLSDDKDGVHPNLAGYKVMEPIVEKAIAEALKGKSLP